MTKTPEEKTARQRIDAKMNLKKFGLSFADYDKLLALGSGGCWICKRLPEARAFDVDHAHEEGPMRVRGLLCSGCNVGLGLLQDSTSILEILASYIELHKEAEIGWFKVFRSGPAERPKNKRSGASGPRVERNSPPGFKWCNLCEKTLALAEFNTSFAQNGIRYPSSYCKPCTYVYSRKWDLEHPEEAKARAFAGRLKMKFNITPEDYAYLLAGQNGVCAGCDGLDKQGERLAVDHDASRGKEAVRGLLCRNCNIGLGAFREDPQVLRAAAQYLRDSKDKAGAWWGKEEDPEVLSASTRIESVEAVRLARIDFQGGRRTRAQIAQDLNIHMQTADDMLQGITWKEAGGPLVVDPGENTPGWSNRESGDSHWTRRKQRGEPERQPAREGRPVCTVVGCLGESSRRNMCQNHYRQEMRRIRADTLE